MKAATNIHVKGPDGRRMVIRKGDEIPAGVKVGAHAVVGGQVEESGSAGGGDEFDAMTVSELDALAEGLDDYPKSGKKADKVDYLRALRALAE